MNKTHKIAETRGLISRSIPLATAALIGATGSLAFAYSPWAGGGECDPNINGRQIDCGRTHDFELAQGNLDAESNYDACMMKAWYDFSACFS